MDPLDPPTLTPGPPVRFPTSLTPGSRQGPFLGPALDPQLGVCPEPAGLGACEPTTMGIPTLSSRSPVRAIPRTPMDLH